VTIEGVSGGPGIATVTNVAIGEAEYGMTASDNILMARAEGIPIVAVWGGMDVSPQCFMAHASAGVETFEDLNGMKISTSPVGTFWPVIKATYDIEPAEELPVVDFGTFLNDDQIVRQCFNISEAFLAQEEGWDVTSSWCTTPATRRTPRRCSRPRTASASTPKEVAAVVAAVRRGLAPVPRG
jgi:NitT/TauT family transport system substrate-binding protein